MKKAKIFCASLVTETNTFSPLPCGFKNFEECYYVENGEHPLPAHYWATPQIVFKNFAKKIEAEFIESISAAAQPAGKVVKKVYESFRDKILSELNHHLDIDLVLLHLHGGMIAEGYDDCEGDLLCRIRAMLGPNAIIGVLLDPHTHFTETMLVNANLFVIMKEYPHIDIEESAQRLADLAYQAFLGKVHPIISVYECGMIATALPTMRSPMKEFVAKIRNLEKDKKNDLLSISIVHGFAWGDVADLGTKVIVITNDNKPYGDQMAQILGKEIFNFRDLANPKFSELNDIQQAYKIKKQDDPPIIVADFADNVGGGATGDSTVLLKFLLQQEEFSKVAFSSLWDPIAVDILSNVGEGGRAQFKFGGKVSPIAGEPVYLEVEVCKILDNLEVKLGDGVFSMGKAVLIKLVDRDFFVVINSNRCQTYSTHAFESFGLNLKDMNLIVVKSSEHFRASFKEISPTILIVATEGILSPKLERLSYKKINKSLWPFRK